jgi:glycosyl transferase family 1
MGISGSKGRGSIARAYVERLETALAVAAHQRDLAEERSRLADEGVAGLERRLDEARVRAEERQRELERNRDAARQLQSELGTALERLGERGAALEAKGVELERSGATVRERERELALAEVRLQNTEARVEKAEARLEKAEQRAEHFRGSLVALREGRAYRLMRVLWRLRRPFRRAPRKAGPSAAPAKEDKDPLPAGAGDASSSRPPRPRVFTPRSPARRLQPGERLRVASILDEMSAACFAPECDLVPLSLDGWAAQLDEHSPDLLLVESAWNGNGGEWQYRIAEYPRKDLAGLPALRALLDGCRERGMPTAFWNKEDPVHFDRFRGAAVLFDHVFTTDARCVERYEALPGERTVTPLPFAAQPRIHNPIAAVPERSTCPCFAGAWYRDRHPARRQALEALLDAARPYGLVIYDRRFGGDDDAFGFPERFAPHVLGKLPYERILDVYKSHGIFLNANSVADSPTMCSRRVFELAACDTAMISTPGAALTALLGEEIVEEARDESDAAAALERLLGDGAERKRRTRAARRTVFAEHTYAERLATIAEVAGLDASSLRQAPFAAARSSNGAVHNGANPLAGGTDDRHPWRLTLAPGVALSDSALGDLAAAATFAEADVIGALPGGDGDPPAEHRYVPDLDPRALLLSRDLVESRGHPNGSAEQIRAQLRQWSDEGIRLYAADADLLVS